MDPLFRVLELESLCIITSIRIIFISNGHVTPAGVWINCSMKSEEYNLCCWLSVGSPLHCIISLILMIFAYATPAIIYGEMGDQCAVFIHNMQIFSLAIVGVFSFYHWDLESAGVFEFRFCTCYVSRFILSFLKSAPSHHDKDKANRSVVFWWLCQCRGSLLHASSRSP